MIAMADPPREDSKKVLEEIKHLGIRVIMLTGDSLIIAKRVAADVLLEEIYDRLLGVSFIMFRLVWVPI